MCSLREVIFFMAITPADIREAVLAGDDFGHEMRVGRVLRAFWSSDTQIEHGGTYVDPVTRKPRQFDFRWRLRKGDGVLHAAVECKNTSAEAPVVVCGMDRVSGDAFHMLVESRNGTFKYGPKSDGRFKATMVGFSSTTWRATGNDAFYPPGGFVGKSLVRIRLDRDKKVVTQ
jgi:hypothetical protein